MAVTITNKQPTEIFGNQRTVRCDVTFDSSYPTGGESPSQGDFKSALGFSGIKTVHIGNKDGYSFEYDYTNHKIKAYSTLNIPPRSIYEHHVLDSSSQFTSDYPPAYVMALHGWGLPIALTTSGATLTAGYAKPDAIFASGETTTFTVSPTNICGSTYLGSSIAAGTFTSNLTGWTVGAAGWAQSSAKAASSAADTLTLNTFAPIIGRRYKLVYTAAITAGTVAASLGGVTGATTSASATVTEYFTATSTAALVFTSVGASVNLTIDDVCLYEQDVWMTYATQGWEDVWDNLVQEEVVTVATNTGTLANVPIAIQCINASTGSTTHLVCNILDPDDSGAGTQGEVIANTSTGALTFNATDAVTAATVTYVKKPSSGFLYERSLQNKALYVGSNSAYIVGGQILLWGYCGQVVEVNAVPEKIIHELSTASTGYSMINFLTGTLIAGQSLSACTGFYIHGTPTEVLGRSSSCEVHDGTDLSSLTVPVTFIGY